MVLRALPSRLSPWTGRLGSVCNPTWEGPEEASPPDAGGPWGWEVKAQVSPPLPRGCRVWGMERREGGLCVPGGGLPQNPDIIRTPPPPPGMHPLLLDTPPVPGNTVVYLRHAASLSCKTLRFLLLTAPDLPECGPTSHVSPPVTLRARAPDLPSCDFWALPPETPSLTLPEAFPGAPSASPPRPACRLALSAASRPRPQPWGSPESLGSHSHSGL